MFVAASTTCFKNLELAEAIEKLVDLEFTCLELCMDETTGHFRPSLAVENFNQAVELASSTRRMSVSGYTLEIAHEGQEYFDVFTACCKMAKANKVVTITVRSGEHGTPFNEEVEKFKKLVAIAEQHGVRVGMRSEHGHLSGDPDQVSVICGHVKGLGLSFDPSQYIYQNEKPSDCDNLMPYFQAVYLRDSTKDDLQVRVGQGVIDYGKLINQLRKLRYDRALIVDIEPKDDIDHMGEMRKMRLLLESLLIV
ncbi:MAG: sugar phosphate isomerase/epimerase [Mariniblastus sp.]|nr:sugar phosphate isomerase/epimerase [Mariniblastus sp.]